MKNLFQNSPIFLFLNIFIKIYVDTYSNCVNLLSYMPSELKSLFITSIVCNCSAKIVII